MPNSVEKTSEAVWQIVHAIPLGRVATYGQVARIAGMPQQSRLVGIILSGLPKGTKIPWHRVINSQGKISNPNSTRQVELLTEEGVILLNGRVSLANYQWRVD